jgi:hypothetical protein
MVARILRQWMAIGMIVTGCGFGTPASLRAQADDAKQEAKDAGKDVKDAAKDTGDAVKDAGKAAAKGTKKGAKKIKRKLTPETTSATCKDGTVQNGKTKTTACADHGGM